MKWCKDAAVVVSIIFTQVSAAHFVVYILGCFLSSSKSRLCVCVLSLDGRRGREHLDPFELSLARDVHTHTHIVNKHFLYRKMLIILVCVCVSANLLGCKQDWGWRWAQARRVTASLVVVVMVVDQCTCKPYALLPFMCCSPLRSPRTIFTSLPHPHLAFVLIS